MSVKEEVAAHYRQMQEKVINLERVVEKYRQETEYVCLKTGVQDWLAFLTEIRMGRITYHKHQQAGKEAKGVSAMGLLEDLFGSSNRSTARQHFCECQSPICSEGSVKRVKGGDTSRSESTPSQEGNYANKPDMHDPFEKYKLEELIQPKQMPEESIEQILKYIEKYEAQKAQPMEGFDTFRKTQKDEALNETRENNSSEKAGEELTASSERLQQAASGKQESHFKPFWRNKESTVLQYREWRAESPPKEYTLAVQNTRLRRQLKQLQARLCA